MERVEVESSSRKSQRDPSPSTKRAMSWHDYVAFVRASRATMFSFAVDGGAKEVGAGILARSVDVIVLGIFAHLEGRWVEVGLCQATRC